jgi:hypothetical protein
MSSDKSTNSHNCDEYVSYPNAEYACEHYARRCHSHAGVNLPHSGRSVAREPYAEHNVSENEHMTGYSRVCEAMTVSGRQ